MPSNAADKLDFVLKQLHCLGAPKALLGLILLLFLSENVSMFGEAYEFVEIFAGEAWVSRVMRSSGRRTASLDIMFGDPLPGKQNVMDLTTPSGFCLALLTILNMKFDASFCVVGLLCSSFVSINQATHCRAPWFPLGDTGRPHVALGNFLASRVALLILVLILGFAWRDSTLTSSRIVRPTLQCPMIWWKTRPNLFLTAWIGMVTFGMTQIFSAASITFGVTIASN
mmetsp:Transcript_45325/g.98649  ORF Transcript_45325/g.98649 Transcript_45325/m.98649 type:complete len:227 (+) Transcript_45325:158-838(+)